MQPTHGKGSQTPTNTRLLPPWTSTPAIEAYRTAVFHSTGLRIQIVPRGRLEPPVGDAFCLALTALRPACAHCRHARAAWPLNGSEEIECHRCFGGQLRWMCAVSQRGRCVAVLRTGLSFAHPPVEADLTRVLRPFDGRLRSAQRSAIRRTYFETPVLEASRLEAAMHGLARLVQAEDMSCRTPAEPCVEPAAVAAARHYIEEHLDRRITLAEVAQRVRMSRFHFCRLFKRSSGMRLVEYLTQSRLRQARALLVDPSLPITEVAMAAGFASMSRFYCAFKRWFGTTPTDFRHRCL